MLINIIHFDERVGLGTFSDWLAEMYIEVRSWRADQGELPAVGDTNPVILLGGYMGVNDRDRLPYLQAVANWVAAVVNIERPLLAICLGGQLLADALGGKVMSQTRQERGFQQIALTEQGTTDPLFAGLPNPFISFEWHNDSFELPDDSILLAQTDVCGRQAFRYKNAWGVQFHPEVDERIIADWCQRTNAGTEPREVFRQHQAPYFAHSRRLLENFVAVIQQI